MTAAKVMDVRAQLPGCAGQAADAVSAYTQVKMGDAPTLLKIPKSESPDIWIRPPTHKLPKSWSSREDPVVPLERNLYGHPLAGLLWKKQLEKVLLEHGWEKSSKLGMSICKQWKIIVLVCVRGRHKVGWEEKEHRSNVETVNETSRFGRTNIIYFMTTSTWSALNKPRYCRQWKKCSNPESPQEQQKITQLGWTWCEHFLMLLWYGRSCKEMSGQILRTCEWNNWATVQSLNSMPWWPSIQRRTIRICWSIAKRVLSNCLEMRVCGTHW